MTTTNTSITGNSSVPSALQSALQGRTDLFCLINGGQGFASLLQQFEGGQTNPPPHEPGKVASTAADNDRGSPDTDAAPKPADAPLKTATAGAPTEQPKHVRHQHKPKADGAIPDQTEVQDQDQAGAVQDTPADTVAVVSECHTVVDSKDSAVVIDRRTPSFDASVDATPQNAQENGAPCLQHLQTAALPSQPGLLSGTLKAQIKDDQNAAADAPLSEAQTTSAGISSDQSGYVPLADVKTSQTGRNLPVSPDAGFGQPNDAPHELDAAVVATPSAKHDDGHDAKTAFESVGAPSIRDEKSTDNGVAGGTSPTLSTFAAAVKAAEMRSAAVANSNNSEHGAVSAAGSAKTEMNGLKLFESTGKLTQGYDTASQLIATKSAKSTGLNATHVIEQVTVKVNQQAKSGLDQMTIQLRPSDLGRVDIKLSFLDGAVTGLVTADNQATLDLLAKDSRSLERALQDAGLRADSGSLSFQLRDPGNQTPSQNGRNAGGKDSFNLELPEDVLAETGGADEAYIIEPNRVNLRV
jgi:flagellar hook-length control protein FliK